MTAQIIECEQGTEAWFRARMGIPTASEFKTIIGIKKDAREKVTRQTYMLKLAGEILTGEPMESYSNAHMERGKVMEDEARQFYSFACDEPMTRVGFVRNGQTGCSPDSLVGTRGMLEIKTALPHILIELLLKDEFPPAHKAQTQGGLWVAERDYIDLEVYWPNLPPLIKRAGRDEPYIAMIAAAVREFNDELAETVGRIRRYGLPPNAIPADLLMAG